MQDFSISTGYENPLRRRFGAGFFSRLPPGPGVYFMMGERNSILYIGKAKCLRARLSQYAQAKPGSAPEHIIEMIENVREISWSELSSDELALELESELLHAIRPPFNIAQTEAEHYLFIGVRAIRGDRGSPRLDFQLSGHPGMTQSGYRVYGCFKHRAKVKRGYTALMRLIFASTFKGPRFSYPARITRASPPWLYRAKFLPDREAELDEFLLGRSARLLECLVQQLLENDGIPRFMRPSIQDDLHAVSEFFRVGPAATFALKRRYGIKSRTLSHRGMDGLVSRDLRARLGRVG